LDIFLSIFYHLKFECLISVFTQIHFAVILAVFCYHMVALAMLCCPDAMETAQLVLVNYQTYHKFPFITGLFCWS